MTSTLHFSGDNAISNLLAQGQVILQPDSDSARLDAQVLLCFVLNQARSYLLTWPEKQVSDQQLAQYIVLLTRRANGEPIAYITGEKEFWSLSFKVSSATLIPRPDTETLVELVLKEFGNHTDIHCLDLGTGTGAIALALASENPTWQIDALDYSLDAVELAKLNAKQLGLTDIKAHVNIFQSDWFAQVKSDKKYNVIVSNPPYIDATDKNLNQGDVRFEPKSALIANEKGLADIKHIAKVARDYLAEHGALFFEHGFDQGAIVRQLLTELGFFDPKTVQDLNGHDRITWAVFLNNRE
ncbi:MAG: peptide chain release factor N(5)-glutamine methyltransferase [Colwellia sp.]|nr:peptide chain release factor N(5)-glutamine methyltransferase [Colwellia sp.]